ncbi:hypothetical protein EV194_10934 [Natronoflexus pectinivorans]|uniref:Uncharacterized protein n=1 Tax=Natronoflexus pectinivorans TaxID=682526 RepID=A0A4R2GGN8_9BACT|nr:hypothetical protein EV194_10934 [Natronoflexus pectinivorans]
MIIFDLKIFILSYACLNMHKDVSKSLNNLKSDVNIHLH